MKKQPVIILHGWGLSAEKFTQLEQEFTSKGYDVFVPDLPGFGKSPPPLKPYFLGDYANFLHTYMEKNSIENPVLVGHSFGGRVSLKYQMLFPGSIRALILTGTPGYTPVPRKRLIFFILFAKMGKAVFSIWPLYLLQENIRKWYYYLVGAREFYRAQGVMRQVFKNIVQEDLMPCMKAVRAPCALVWGADDRITPLWIARRMHEVITGSQLIVIPDSDHGVSFKQAQKFMSAVSGFLKTI